MDKIECEYSFGFGNGSTNGEKIGVSIPLYPANIFTLLPNQ